MPTFVSAVAPFTPLMLPRTRLLLCVTWALKPMAVALQVHRNYGISSNIGVYCPLMLEKPALTSKIGIVSSRGI